MRIGIDISQVVYRGGGVATYTANLVKNLLKLDNSDEYTFFASSLRRKTELESFWQSLDGIAKKSKRFYPFPPVILEALWNRWHTVPIELLIKGIDVFHTSDWLEPPASIPKVTTIHDLIVLKFQGDIPSRIVENQKRKLAWVKKEEKLIIADSYATKEDIINILKIPEDKIRVIHLAPGEEFKRENMVLKVEVVREKYGLNKPFFLSVGTRAPRKNLNTSVSAYSNFKAKNGVEYVIAGNFGWGEDIKPVSGVKIIGFIPNDELAALYQEAVGFIYPSFYEGFGLPILEAESMGCPVIASENGSIKEVLAKSALRINPEKENDITEAMEQLYEFYESTKYFDMIKEGIEFAKQFSWEKTARKTKEVYQEVIENF